MLRAATHTDFQDSNFPWNDGRRSTSGVRRLDRACAVQPVCAGTTAASLPNLLRVLLAFLV